MNPLGIVTGGPHKVKRDLGSSEPDCEETQADAAHAAP